MDLTDKESKELQEGLINSMWISMEWGFKAHEQGWNLDKAKEEFKGIINREKK